MTGAARVFIGGCIIGLVASVRIFTVRWLIVGDYDLRVLAGAAGRA